MNARSTATGATAAILPGAVIIGAGLLVSSLTGLRAERDHYRAEAARPRPTVTRTTVVPVVTRTTVPAPSATPSASPTSEHPAAGTVLAAGEPPAHAPAVPAVHHPGAGAPSGPSPTPPADRQSGAGLRATVRLPLGVLPDVDLTVGGSK